MSIQNNFVSLHHNKQIKEIRIMKKYWLINVIGVVGYSFVVHCGAQTAEEVIDIARDADLFIDYDDWKIASAEEADDDTIKHFNEWECTHEL